MQSGNQRFFNTINGNLRAQVSWSEFLDGFDVLELRHGRILL